MDSTIVTDTVIIILYPADGFFVVWLCLTEAHTHLGGADLTVTRDQPVTEEAVGQNTRRRPYPFFQ